jgi:hypothetical protein
MGAGGAVSFPAYDDMYMSLVVGASLEHKKYGILYVLPTFYFAAENPVKTAYVGNYMPRLQELEFGVQGRLWEYTATPFVRIGPLKNSYAIRLTRSINFSPNVGGDIGIGGGLTDWKAELGGRKDVFAMAFATIVIGGRYVNSTNRARYEHFQAGGVPQAEIEIPTSQNPGPYGFGRSGDATVDAQINQAKERLLGASTFGDFAGSYKGAPTSDIIMAARFIGAFMGQVAYANDAWKAMTSFGFFDSEVKRIASAKNEDMLSYLKRYVDWYNTHNPNEQLPDDLKKGIAVCAGMHSLVGDFLRANGIPAIVASVNTRGGPHVIAIGKFPDKTVLFDYGDLFTTPPKTFDQMLRLYGQQRQAPIFQSQLFGGKGYLGTYVTPEGRLLHETQGIYMPRFVLREFLGVR